MTDQEIGEDIGMGADAVGRARRALKVKGLIAYEVTRINGTKVTLIKVVAPPDDESKTADPQFQKCGSAVSKNADPQFPEKCGSAFFSSSIESFREVKKLLASAEADAGSEKAPEVAAKPTDDPLTATAHRLAILAMEQPVKPVIRGGASNTFVAVMTLVKAQLRAGRSASQIEGAIRDGIDVWTTAGLATAISKRRLRLQPELFDAKITTNQTPGRVEL